MVDNKEKITKKQNSKKSRKNISTKKTNKNRKGKNPINKKLIFGLIAILVIGVILISSLVFTAKEKVVLTIDNIEYTESDFNMYAYLIKYDYFGINGTKLSEETLNTQVSNESKQTIGEYLKEKTISKIKVSAAILRLADENNITLDEEDLKEIDAEKNKFIEKLGGKHEYKKLLKDNHTNTDSYIEVAKVDKLYDKIYDALYKEGKRNDLTTEELDKLEKSYKKEYVKIKQIILLKKDLETNKYLSDTVLNQKEILAKSLVKMAKDGSDFDSLIEKYSESYTGKIESEYYLKSSLVDELKKAVNSLEVGDISGVVSSEYAYHIVIREKLDNSKLEDYYNSKREEKLIEDITDNLEKIAILNSDYLEKITIK